MSTLVNNIEMFGVNRLTFRRNSMSCCGGERLRLPQRAPGLHSEATPLMWRCCVQKHFRVRAYPQIGYRDTAPSMASRSGPLQRAWYFSGSFLQLQTHRYDPAQPYAWSRQENGSLPALPDR